MNRFKIKWLNGLKKNKKECIIGDAEWSLVSLCCRIGKEKEGSIAVEVKCK